MNGKLELAIHLGQRRIPLQQPSTLSQSVLWIAKLDGFFARRGNGFRDVKTVWRGLSRIDAEEIILNSYFLILNLLAELLGD
jgi:hypothetical protein